MKTQYSEGRRGFFTRNVQAVFRQVTMRWALLAVAVGLLSAAALRGETVYNNSTNDLKVRFNPGTVEVGDQIILTGAGRFLTNFSFEYWGTATGGDNKFAGHVEARLRFYQNDGAVFNDYIGPGTVFYDSDWFAVAPSERNTLIFEAGADLPAGGLFMPSTNFTWSVQFQGLGTGDAAGVDIYSPVVVGQGYPDYWENTATSWQLKANPTAPMNFAAVFQASETPVTTLPALTIAAAGDKVVLSWPLWAYNFAPESSPSVTALTWTLLTDPIYRTADGFVVTNTPPATPVFYRLHQQ